MAVSESESEIAITLEDRAYLRESFDKYAGKNAKLNKKQLSSLLFDTKVCKDPLDAADMARKNMDKFDTDGDSKMGFDEYIQFVGKKILKAKLVRDDWKTETLRRAFRAADKDKSGNLNAEEIRALADPAPITIEAREDEKFDFDKSLPYLRQAAKSIEASIDDQVAALFSMLGKEEDGMDAQDVRKTIKVLTDMLTAFKKVDLANGGKPTDVEWCEDDANAPIPKDRALHQGDVADLFTFYHYRRLELENAKR